MGRQQAVPNPSVDSVPDGDNIPKRDEKTAPVPETPETPEEPSKQIAFTLTGAGSFTCVGLACVRKGATVLVGDEMAAHLRKTGLFKEE